MVRIVSWNVNGIKTLKPSVQAVLDSLQADIICLQETRVKASDRDLENVALVPGYDGFFSFSTTRDGYSGVATFTRQTPTTSLGGCPVSVTPVDAGEGLDNAIGGAGIDSDDLVGDPDGQSANGTLRHVSVTGDDLDAVRNEGRVVVTDHSAFVLVNVYVPAVSVEERIAFKLAFCRALESKLRALRRLKRDVVVVGDFNIAPDVIDVAERVSDTKEFHARPSRAWLRNVILGELEFADVYRFLNPHDRSAFTCWSEATRARENNYGVRIDLTLASAGFVRKSVTGAAVQAHVTGSDHCPILVEISDDAFRDCPCPRSAPPFCIRNMSRFRKRQTRIVDALKVQGQRDILGYNQGVSEHARYQGSCLERCTNSAVTKPVNASSSSSTSEQSRLSALSQKKRPISRPSKSRIAQRTRQSNITSFFSVPRTKQDFAAQLRSRPTAAVHKLVGQSSGSVRVEKCKTIRDVREESSRKQDSVPDAVTPVATSESHGMSRPTTLARSVRNSGSHTATDQAARSAWDQLLSGPRPPPRCRHGEPAQLRTVQKTGPNRGRTFYGCARPAGNWPRDRGANCNFFQWAPYTAGAMMPR